MQPSQDRSKRAVSAARMAPLADSGPRLSGARLRAGAVETLLNGAGLLRDVWADFQSSDRYFKYKAMVLLCWLALTVTSFGVACPTSGFRTNSYGARLVIAGEANSPIYMVKNDSTDAWQNVEVLVNGAYRSTAAQVDSQREITLSPIILFDSTGTRAPSNLKITEIEVQIADHKVELLQGGLPH